MKSIGIMALQEFQKNVAYEKIHIFVQLGFLSY